MKLPGKSKNETEKDAISAKKISPSANVASIMHLLMFGGDASPNENIVLNQCDDGLFDCDKPTRVKIKDSDWYKTKNDFAGISLTHYGFFGATWGIVMGALNKLDKNGSSSVVLPSTIYPANTMITPALTAEKFNAFLKFSPLPLYRAMNIAMVHPVVGRSLVAQAVRITAAHFAIAYLRQTVLDWRKAGKNKLASKYTLAIETAIREANARLDEKFNVLLSKVQAREAWINTLNQLEGTFTEEALGLDGIAGNFARERNQ